MYLTTQGRVRVQGSSMLKVQGIRTEVFKKGDSLETFLAQSLGERTLHEVIVVVTSKIVSVDEGGFVPKHTVSSKAELISQEADRVLGEGPYGVWLTVKHGIFIPSAGIDESNVEEESYLVFPKDPFASAERIGKFLRSRYQSERIGVIISDSHTTPLRWGVTGIGLAFWGFKPVKNLVGAKDIFGRPLQFTRVNIVDALSASAVLVMGESDDRKPLALVEGAEIEWTSDADRAAISIPPEEDLYRDFFKFS